MLGADGQAIVLDVDLDVLLVEAGQFRLQLEGVAGIDHVGTEGRDHASLIAEEAALQLIELPEGVHGGEMTDMTIKRNDFKHVAYLLLCFRILGFGGEIYFSRLFLYIKYQTFLNKYTSICEQTMNISTQK